MDDKTKTLVQESWAQVKPISDKAAELFYGRLFELDPTVKFLFKSPIPVQGKLLMKAIDAAVAGLDDLDALVPVLQGLGKRHAPYGVVAADYDTVGAAFLWTLEQGLGDGFTPEVKAAWTEVYGVIASVMIEAQGTVDISGPVSPRQKRLVQGSWEVVMPIADTAAGIFYGRLFELDPSLKPLFKGSMEEQGKKLMQMLTVAVRGLDRLDQIVPAVQDLGKRHVGYGVKDAHYDTVGAAFVYTLEQGLGDQLTDEVKESWIHVYGVLASVMKEAAAEAPVAAPKAPEHAAADGGGVGAGMLFTALFVAFTVAIGFF